MHKTLYLCYFGLREPLVQTQVLPYLREIKKLENIEVSLLTFEPDFKEKWTDEQVEAERKKLTEENISWYCLPYHKRPSAPATAYDIFNGALLVRNLIRREKIDILHARVHTPAMMGAIARKLSGENIKILFDIRGFFPEEYTDAGNWKENGLLYKSVKKAEKWLFRQSDGFVVLTERGREILFPESKETGFDQFGRPVEVIPCCVDFNRFEIVNDALRIEMRRKLNVENRRVIVYVGSFGGWYLTEEMANFFGTAKKRDASTFALVLTQSKTEIIADLLQKRGFSEDDFFIKKVLPGEIPAYLSAADIALSFIKACYSKQASSPTKIAEYLDAIIKNEKVGAIIEGFDEKSYSKALQEVEQLRQAEGFSDHCRQTAKRLFDLEEVGGKKYRNIYRNLLKQ
jgi:glycosyltransferase involved in cell wall biosynthesis